MDNADEREMTIAERLVRVRQRVAEPNLIAAVAELIDRIDDEFTEGYWDDWSDRVS